MKLESHTALIPVCTPLLVVIEFGMYTPTGRYRIAIAHTYYPYWSLSNPVCTPLLVVIEPAYTPLMVVIEKENNRIRDQNMHLKYSEIHRKYINTKKQGGDLSPSNMT